MLYRCGNFSAYFMRWRGRDDNVRRYVNGKWMLIHFPFFLSSSLSLFLSHFFLLSTQLSLYLHKRKSFMCALLSCSIMCLMSEGRCALPHSSAIFICAFWFITKFSFWTRCVLCSFESNFSQFVRSLDFPGAYSDIEAYLIRNFAKTKKPFKICCLSAAADCNFFPPSCLLQNGKFVLWLETPAAQSLIFKAAAYHVNDIYGYFLSSLLFSSCWLPLCKYKLPLLNLIHSNPRKMLSKVCRIEWKMFARDWIVADAVLSLLLRSTLLLFRQLWVAP